MDGIFSLSAAPCTGRHSWDNLHDKCLRCACTDALRYMDIFNSHRHGRIDNETDGDHGRSLARTIREGSRWLRALRHTR
jgi:hypothetical protein